MTVAEPTTRRWTREEYYQLAEQGLFEGQRVQLIHGEIIQMPPIGSVHATALVNSMYALLAVFGKGPHIRPQLPLNVGTNSDPEPDLAVVEGWTQRYVGDHPTTAVLVVEISDSTLRHDHWKANLYASAGVPEYWIVDVNARQLEVYREPQPSASEEFGYRYSDPQTLSLDQTVSPLARPKARIRVADLFPEMSPEEESGE